MRHQSHFLGVVGSVELQHEPRRSYRNDMSLFVDVAKANIQFKRLVKLNERVIAKAKVTKIDGNLGRTSVEVASFVNNELVFTGEFEMYRSKNR